MSVSFSLLLTKTFKNTIIYIYLVNMNLKIEISTFKVIPNRLKHSGVVHPFWVIWIFIKLCFRLLERDHLKYIFKS